MEMIRSKFKAVATEYQEDGVIEVIVNSGKLDRQGEILDIKGLDLSNYLESPVVAWGHKYDEPAIGKALRVWKDDATGALKAVVKFAIEHSDMAKLVYNLIKDDYMNAFSIGFIPLEAEEDEQGNVVYTKSEMLEFSAVLVGADPRALATAKSIGGEDAVKALKGEMNIKEFHFKKEEPKEKSPMCRMSDESKNECIARKIPEIMDENPDMEKEQVIAMAEEMCSKKCESGKSIDTIAKVGSVLSKANRTKVQNAIEALQGVLDADAKNKPKEDAEKNIEEVDDVAVKIAEKALDGIKTLKGRDGRTDYKKVKKIGVILYRAANEIIVDAKAKENDTIKIKRIKK